MAFQRARLNYEAPWYDIPWYDISPAPFLSRFDDAVNSNPFKSLFDQPSFILPVIHSVKDLKERSEKKAAKEGFEKEAAKEGFDYFVKERRPFVNRSFVKERRRFVNWSFVKELVEERRPFVKEGFEPFIREAAKEGSEHFVKKAAKEGLEPLVKTLDVQEIPISFYSEKFGGVDKINCHGGLHFPNYFAVAA